MTCNAFFVCATGEEQHVVCMNLRKFLNNFSFLFVFFISVTHLALFVAVVWHFSLMRNDEKFFQGANGDLFLRVYSPMTRLIAWKLFANDLFYVLKYTQPKIWDN
jgi:hypothetical protein